MTGLLSPIRPSRLGAKWPERQCLNIVENLRSLVLAPPANCERFHTVFLDGDRNHLGSMAIGEGRVDALSLSLRDLFQSALAVHARGMVLAHNHPSGDCSPSAYDIQATKKISEVAIPLGIELIDHLIFSGTSVYSMRKGGEL